MANILDRFYRINNSNFYKMDKNILRICMEKGFFLDKDLFDLFSNLSEKTVLDIVLFFGDSKIKERVFTKKILKKHYESISVAFEINDQDKFLINSFLGEGFIKNEKFEEKEGDKGIKKEGSIKLISAPAFTQKKIEVKDFVSHFRDRYEKIKKILEQRDFDNLSSIRKIGDNHGSYTIIAMVSGKRITKNKNIFIEVEDLTGNSIVLVNQNKKEVFDIARDLLEDDVVAFSVSGTKDMLFANDIIYPDASLGEKKYSDYDEYIAFTGDLHVGSTMFLEKNFLRFIKWLNGEEGDENQKELAKKVKYLLFTGDNIDGVNHYPGQEKYLVENTSVGQYGKVASMLKLIRKDIKIIICPGQHDSVWVGEPQPIIPEMWAEELYKLENVVLVPNPSLVEIDGGFKILMYHGASLNKFIDEIPDIRTNFGHTSPTRVVKEILKRRHLAPIHGGMDYIPCEKGDPLVIDIVPDIIATADQHRPEISIYNNILLVASSCWQSITPFEEKVGNVPDPCKVPLFNLKSREIKILDFSDSKKEIKWENNEDLVCYMKECPNENCIPEKSCVEVKK